MNTTHYDIIGDIHGHADKLIELLTTMGYSDDGSGYRHPTRKVIFLGDFIDRGSEQRQVLDIVMPMVQNRHALAVMGNHEFNALGYHTKNGDSYLRPHINKNKDQHQAFLQEFDEDDPQLQAVLDFFYSLPLWVEIDNIRVVHACWDPTQIAYIRKYLQGSNGLLTPATLNDAFNSDHPLFHAIERVLKGVEIPLPQGVTFKDKDGHPRSDVRVQWWKWNAEFFQEIALPIDLDIGEAGKQKIPAELLQTIPFYPVHAVPCFIGHYWMPGEPFISGTNVACLDFSVAKKGKLVAYRWSGEQQLHNENLCYV